MPGLYDPLQLLIPWLLTARLYMSIFADRY